MKTALNTILLVMAGFILASGCATKVKYSGFIEDYPEFKSGPKGGADLVYIKEGADFKAYNKVMMDHVVFYFHEDAKYKGVRPDELQKLANAFHRTMVEALEGGYPLVDQPGPDVLRLRVAITDMVPSKTDVFTMTTAILPTDVETRLKTGITGGFPSIGQASMEVELLDSQTNERLAAAIDTKATKKFGVMVGKWEHVEDAFMFWAKRLRLFLDVAHSKK